MGIGSHLSQVGTSSEEFLTLMMSSGIRFSRACLVQALQGLRYKPQSKSPTAKLLAEMEIRLG